MTHILIKGNFSEKIDIKIGETLIIMNFSDQKSRLNLHVFYIRLLHLSRIYGGTV